MVLTISMSRIRHFHQHGNDVQFFINSYLCSYLPERGNNVLRND